MRLPRGALALVAVALSVAGGPIPARADLPILDLQDELRDGDDQCTNLCDRYGFVWEPGTEVELRLVTVGFSAYINVDGPAVHEVSENPGREARIVFVTPPGRSAPYTVLINAYNYYDRGPYRLQVSPRPLRYLAPAARPAAPQLSPEEQETDDAVLRTVDTLTNGLRPSGREIRGRLERLPALRFATKRGRCYRAMVILDSDARWRRTGARTPTTTLVHMMVRSPHEARTTAQTGHTTARVVALDDEVCPSANGTAEVTFQDRANGMVASDAGVGGFVVRLYERAIRTAELDARDAAENRGVCAACMQQRGTCQLTGNAGNALTCADQFRDCLGNAGLTTRTCAP